MKPEDPSVRGDLGTGTTGARSHRLAALDWMRGLIMVLMAVDHASDAFNLNRRMAMADSLWMTGPGPVLGGAHFLTRWITHICAPGFLFLAGVGLALMIAKARRAGDTEGAIDRHLLLRGLIIAAFDLILITPLAGGEVIILQVLYAIGASFILMIPLRRLPVPVLVGLGLGILVGAEAILRHFNALGEWTPPLWLGTTLGVSFLGGGPEGGGVFVLYPVLPWLGMLLLGFGFGTHLLGSRSRPSGSRGTRRLLVVCGLAALAGYLILRGLDGYGNMGFHRKDATWESWLRVSKYPPSLTFAGLELGIMALLLAGFFKIEASLDRPPRPSNPLTVFGQTPFFFYILHFPILVLTSKWLGVHQKLGLAETWAAAAGVCLLLYPACRWYARYKAAHPRGWTRYL